MIKSTITKFQMEAPVGFEPTIKVLQTHALPLGYGAMFNCNIIIPHFIKK